MSRAVDDIMSSILMSWLGVVALVARSTPRGSIRLPRWWQPAPRWLMRPVSWLASSGFRSVKPAGMSSVLPSGGRWRRRNRRRCSPSSCPRRWWRECAHTPPGPGGPSPRWSPRRWRSFCHETVGGVHAGEWAHGRERVRFRPTRSGGVVGRLSHSGPRAAAAPGCRRRGSESPR